MLDNLPDLQEIERNHRGSSYRLMHKFPEWFFSRHPEIVVGARTDMAVSIDPEYVCSQQPEWMAQYYPHVLAQYRPEWMCHHDPEWVFDKLPWILFKVRPEWMVQNKIEWVASYRFHWMQENHLDKLNETLPDPEYHEPDWMSDLILKHNN